MPSVPFRLLLPMLLLTTASVSTPAQSPDLQASLAIPEAPRVQTQTQTQTQTTPSTIKPLTSRAPLNPNAPLTLEQAETLRTSKLAIVNGRPYDQPTKRVIFEDYVTDTYGLPAISRTVVRALYSEGRDAPRGWGQDLPGFLQRFGANAGQTIVSGNVRYAMEVIFHEDLRYIPCHGCTIHAKIENALLAEVTARHATDGHRFFTLTPTIADFSGPIVAHTLWYPGGVNPSAGAVSARLAFATRVGSHLFREFILERRHTDTPIER